MKSRVLNFKPLSNFTCLAAVSVFRIDNAKAIAPRSPVMKSMCCRFIVILCFRPKLRRNDNGYTFKARPTMMETKAAKMKPAKETIYKFRDLQATQPKQISCCHFEPSPHSLDSYTRAHMNPFCATKFFTPHTLLISD